MALIMFDLHHFCFVSPNFSALSPDSAFRFLLEQWKEQLPPGFLLRGASVEQPFEEDPCCCNFDFVKDECASTDAELFLKYQWFIGDKTPSNFRAIPGATEKVESCLRVLNF